MLDTHTETTAMLPRHPPRASLVNGFSGYAPPHYDALQRRLTQRDPDALRELTSSGPLAVLVNTARDGDGKIREFVSGMPGVKLVRETAVGPVFLIPNS